MKVIIIFLFVLQNLISLECTDRPIIGVLSQEFWRFGKEYYPATNYIAASYVKAVETAGARVVPIFINKDLQYYEHLLHSINGVVIPGGSVPLAPKNGYYDAVTIIYKLAKEMNKNGIKFPILGICLGFEALLIISNNHTASLKRCNILHENYPLIFANNFRHSLTFSHLPEVLYVYFKYFDVTKNNHNWCMTQRNLTKYSLDKKWLVTTKNIDTRGDEFISSIEHKIYPFIGLQFHPEKMFEWNPLLNNPHSRISIKANRYFYDLFVDLAKLNNNAFTEEKEEQNALIYNHSPKMMIHKDFDQIYVFK